MRLKPEKSAIRWRANSSVQVQILVYTEGVCLGSSAISTPTSAETGTSSFNSAIKASARTKAPKPSNARLKIGFQTDRIST